jgi:high-affinity nickel-transport protein
VAVALVIGTVELGGLLAQKLGAHGPFWAWLEHIDIGSLGVIVVAMFLGTWVLALSIWRFGRFEERYGATLAGDQASGV